jgi:phosphatidylglycerol:prolipoprotein diacylglycerol transferase
LHPVLLQFGQWTLPTYAAFIGLAGVVALLYLRALGRRFRLFPQEDFWLLTNLVGLAGFLGGRLLEAWPLLGRSGRGTALIFADEGLPTYGILIGVMAGVCLYCRLRNGRYLRVLDCLFLAVPLCHGIARLGCFMAGCCYGRPEHGNFLWAVVFTHPLAEVPSVLQGVPLYPTQLYEAAGDFVIAAVLRFLVWPRVHTGGWRPGSVFFGYLLAYGALRFANDFLRGDSDPFLGTRLTTAQALSLGAMLISAGWFFAFRIGGSGPAEPAAPSA